MDMSGHSNTYWAAKAKSLIGLTDWQFVVQITVLESLFSIAKILCDQLQSKDVELASATEWVASVVESLYAKSNADAGNKIWESASDACSSAWVEINMRWPQQVRRKAKPCHMQAFVMKQWNMSSAIHPKHNSFLGKQCLWPMAKTNLNTELHQAKRLNSTCDFLTLTIQRCFFWFAQTMDFCDITRDLSYMRIKLFVSTLNEGLCKK